MPSASLRGWRGKQRVSDGASLEFGLFFQLPQADGQDVAARYRDTLAQIVEGDRLGFDLAWLAEMHFVRKFSVLPSPIVAMAAAAAQTTRIRLGTGVALIPLVEPIRAAEDAATLDIISGGRLEYGVGRGSIAEHFNGFGVPIRERAARFDEALEVMLQAWSDEPVNFRGQFFDYADVQVVPKPLQRPHPPLRLAANSDESFERAAAEGWRVFASPITAFSEDLDRRFAEYWRARSAAEGARPPATDAGLLLPVHIAESGEQAREEARASLMSYIDVIIATGRRSIIALGGDSDNLPPLMERNSSFSYEQLIAETGAIGSAEEVAATLAGLHERYGVGHFLTWCNPGGMIPHEQVLRSMRLLMEEVAPALRG